MGRYLLVCDCEIMRYGTKKHIMAYYKELPNPMPMKLYKVVSEENIYNEKKRNTTQG